MRRQNRSMDARISSEAGEADGRANSHNGYCNKRVLNETGNIDLEVPRDRLSTFDPQLIAKYQRRFPVSSMYARGRAPAKSRGICASSTGSTSPRI